MSSRRPLSSTISAPHPEGAGRSLRILWVSACSLAADSAGRQARHYLEQLSAAAAGTLHIRALSADGALASQTARQGAAPEDSPKPGAGSAQGIDYAAWGGAKWQAGQLTLGAAECLYAHYLAELRHWHPDAVMADCRTPAELCMLHEAVRLGLPSVAWLLGSKPCPGSLPECQRVIVLQPALADYYREHWGINAVLLAAEEAADAAAGATSPPAAALLELLKPLLALRAGDEGGVALEGED